MEEDDLEFEERLNTVLGEATKLTSPAAGALAAAGYPTSANPVPAPVDPSRMHERFMENPEQSVSTIGTSVVDELADPVKEMLENERGPIVYRGAILPKVKYEDGSTGWGMQSWLNAGVKMGAGLVGGDPGMVETEPGYFMQPTLAEDAFEAVGMGTAGAIPARVAVNAAPAISKQSIIAAKAKQVDVTPKIIDINAANKYPSAPKDLQSLETAGDLFKTYALDEKTVLADIAERAGIPEFDKVKQAIDADTQVRASMRVNNFMKTGYMRHTDGDIAVRVTPDQLLAKVRQLPEPAQKAADDYMKLNDFADDLRIRINDAINRAKKEGVEPGPELQKDRDALNRVTRQIYGIRKSYPVVDSIADEYRHITGQIRNFIASGPNAMIDPDAKKFLDANRRNYVPIDVSDVNPNAGLLTRMGQASEGVGQKTKDWFLMDRDIKDIKGINNRVNSFEILSDYTRNVLRYKMENDTRGKYIRAMQQSRFGGNTMRKADGKELDEFQSRAVEVYENGKKEKYLSSQLQAQLLRFDPYIAKYPGLYAPKRLFEQGTTGVLSMTFAPTTLLRDSVAGWVLNPSNVAAGPLSIVAAVPKQLYAKGLEAASEMFTTNLKNVPLINSERIGRNLAGRYMNTMYQMANQVGGFDASLMKSKLEIGRGVMNEISKSMRPIMSHKGVQYPMMPLKTAAKGFAAVFDAIQEAPRYASFEKQVKAGVDPTDAATRAKLLTGDTTRSGRVHDPYGARIDADIVNPEWKTLLHPAGEAIELMRESIPYVNPAAQGMRKLYNAYRDDPAGTSAKAWAYVGIPTITAFAWNEQLGPEYNDFAQTLRTGNDMAMNLYIGIPGKPPEEGLQIPIAHEMIWWHSPFNTGLYSLSRGQDAQEFGQAITYMGLTMLENAAMIGTPTVVDVGAAAAGIKAPESILHVPRSLMGGDAGIYQIREDNVGFLPENAERTVRAMFGSIGDTLLDTSMAFHDGGPEAAMEELGYNLASRTPIVKNVMGTVTPRTNFSPDSQIRQNKIEHVMNMLKIWEEHYGELEGGFNKSEFTRGSPLPSSKGRADEDSDMSLYRMAPTSVAEPTNQFFKDVGAVLDAKLRKNDEGMVGLRARYSSVNEQINLLRKYTAGKGGAGGSFKEYQDKYMNVDTEAETRMQEMQAELQQMESEVEPLRGVRGLGEEDAARRDELYKKIRSFKTDMKNTEFWFNEKIKAKKLIEENEIDLGTRDGVNKLIGILERDKEELLNQQLKLIEEVEDDLTTKYQELGIVGPNFRYKVERHFIPFVSQSNSGSPDN